MGIADAGVTDGADLEPAAVGAKVTLNVQLSPEAKTPLQRSTGSVVKVKSESFVPPTLMELITTGSEPVLVNVAVWIVLVVFTS